MLDKKVQRHLKTQEMCDEAVGFEPCSLAFVPERFKLEGLKMITLK